MEEKVSIIIPTFNRGNIISKSIYSVLNQTYKNLEVIVVDDGSTDNTNEIIKSIKDERVKYIPLQHNSGACIARNTGIKYSTGDYIGFNDSDDVFAEDKIEKQIKNIKKYNSDIDFCKIAIHSSNSVIFFPSNDQIEAVNHGQAFEKLAYGNYISTITILAKKKVFERFRFDDKLPRLQDYDLLLRTTKHFNLSYTDETLVNAYRQNDSISSNINNVIPTALIMLKKDYGFNEQLQDVFYSHLIQFCISCYVQVEKENNEQTINGLKALISDMENTKTWKIHNLINSIINRK
ncbi:MAG: glycosyltransferase family 2 protein [Clostridia bacterium]|nr:glycosyltransferase family 2 protein [Clostridia bacterium]